MCRTRVSWTPEAGGLYPVICERCDRIIGGVETIVDKDHARKMAAALHRCPVAEISLTNPDVLTKAQVIAGMGNFIMGNELLKQAYKI